MRRSDIFTLSEVFYEGQYQCQIPIANSPTIVDAGASIWPCEPESENYELLRGNIGELEGVQTHRVALGNTDGSVELHLAEHGALHTIENAGAGSGSVQVGCAWLDTFMATHSISSIDLLKLDVEGAELEVLEGLGARIHQVRAIIGEVYERWVDSGLFYERFRASGFSHIRRVDFRESETNQVHGFEASR